MKKTKPTIISICLTVFNEEKTIDSLLHSLLSQTKKPDEIVICDGGSSDGTVQIIKKIQKKNSSITLFTSKGNVAHGRNVAIKHARGELIACIDAGCVARRDWLHLLMKEWERGGSRIKSGMTNNSIISGFYEMKWTNSFQKIMSLYRGTHPKRYDPKMFIPSCRSVLFSKNVWKQLKGFDESLSLSGEDTDFFYRAVKAGYTINRVKNAIVYWNEPKQFSFKDFKKFYYYAKGDAQTGIWWDPIKKFRTHNIKILTIYIRYSIFSLLIIANWIPVYAGMTNFVFLVFSFLFYVSWSVWKWRDVVTDWRERLWIPVIQIGTDMMVMAGFLVGMVLR